MNRSMHDRFWGLVAKTETCWLWKGNRYSTGYGAMRGVPGYKARALHAHRVGWELIVGPIPEGMTIDHLCLNKLCVNPSHLEVVTRGENTRRYWLSRTHCKSGHPFSVENTYIDPLGKRVCKTCRLAARRRCDAKRALRAIGADATKEQK